MRYYVRSRREHTERTVSPQRLVHWRNTWYLDAWCHDSDALRRFALDAIGEAELVDDEAKDVPVSTIEAELDGGYGVFSGGRVQWATLRFTSEAAQWVRHEQWHPQQQSTLADDGALTLRVPYADATELAMDVLRHGEQVQVMAPASLAKAVAKRLQEAAAQYAVLSLEVAQGSCDLKVLSDRADEPSRPRTAAGSDRRGHTARPQGDPDEQSLVQEEPVPQRMADRCKRDRRFRTRSCREWHAEASRSGHASDDGSGHERMAGAARRQDAEKSQTSISVG